MKTVYKIAIIIAVISVGLILSQILVLVVSIQLGGLLVNSVPNEAFDREMRQTDAVELFHQKYGDSDVHHSGDIVAWKQISYVVSGPDGNQKAELFVKKSMSHGKIRMQFSCIYDVQAYQQYHQSFEQGNRTGYDESKFALYLSDQDAITKHLTEEHCFAG